MQRVHPLGSTLIAVLLPYLSVAQDPLDRYTFISMAMVVTDQERLVQAFMGDEERRTAVIWVRIADGVQGFGPDEVYERVGRNGLVIIAPAQWLEAQGVPHELVFSTLAKTDDSGITSTFQLVRRLVDGSPLAPIHGQLWFPMYDGSGPSRVTFTEEPPVKKRRGDRARTRLRIR